MKKIKFLLSIFLIMLIIPTPVRAAEADFCLRTSAIWQFIGYALYAVKIIIPLIIIVFGIIDFIKAVMSSDDNAIKKAATSLLKRAIAGVIIFFVPTIVTVVFNLIENFTGGLEPITECKTCLLNPTSDTCEGYIKEAEDLRKANN